MVLVGGVMYAMVFTRPDIAYHVSKLASCMQKPSTYAFECILSVVDYLQNTNDLGITFGNAHGITGIYEASTVEEVSPEMQPVTWNDSAFGDLSPHMGCFVRSNYGASSWISKQIKFFTPN